MGKPRVGLTRFLLMFSDALELAAPGMALHQTKAAFVALRVAEALGLSEERVRDLVHAALLHDIGALSPEEKIQLHSPNPRLIERHCRNGQAVLDRVGFFRRTALLVGAHHAPWGTTPELGPEEARDANVIALADAVELAIDRSGYILLQSDRIRRLIGTGRGTSFAPELVDAFLEASEAEEFWLELASPRLPADLAEFADSGGLGQRFLTIEEFAAVSTLVRDIIDFRSTFTATHSSGVATAAAALGRLLGYSESEALALKVAGNLHDLGKMAVPNAILLKPAELDPTESAVMRQHPYHTWAVLTRAGLPTEIIEWAAWHHERLDGSGYPFHLEGREIGLGSRILSAADILTALAEDRPYRLALRRTETLRTMDALSLGGVLEPGIVEAITSSYDGIVEEMDEAQRQAAEFYGSRVEPAS